MIYPKKGILSYFVKPLLVMAVIAGILGIARVRSRIVSIEYQIGSLSQEKTKILRDMKLLVARRAEAYSANEVGARGIRHVGLKYPDRRKVFYVKRTETGVFATSAMGEKIGEKAGGNP